jgi:soluble lytic murein transglycosylase-like protein
MRRATALLSAVCVMAPAFAGDPLSVREYEERCANYYARQHGVSPALVRAIIQIESAWQPGVVSSKGAMGLMQLMPATAQHFGVTHPFYIHENVRGGVAYLAELQALFQGDFRLVMAAYAAGEKPILARGLNYSSEEVYIYVQRVAQQYRTELGRKGGR